MEQKKEKLWTYEFIIICLVSMAVRLSSSMRGTTVPLFMREFLGYDKSTAGLMTSIYAITALILRPLMGHLVDKKGRRTMLSVGTAIYAVTLACFGMYKSFPVFLQSLWVLYAIQIINGIGFSANSVAMSTMSTDLIPNSRMTEGIGYFGVTSTVTQAFAPSLALFAIARYGHENTFLIVSGFAVVAFAMGFMVKYEKRRITELNDRPEAKVVECDIAKEKPSFWDNLFEKHAIVPASIMMLSMFGGSTMSTFLPIYANERGLALVGLVFTLQAFSAVIPRLFISKLIKLIGEAKTLVLGYICEFAGFALMFCVSTALPDMLVKLVPFLPAEVMASMPLFMAGIFIGLAKALVMIVLNSEAIVPTPKQRRGAANATFYIFMDLGVAVGAAAWGKIADIFGTRWIYFGAAVFSVLAYIGSTKLRRQMKERRDLELLGTK